MSIRQSFKNTLIPIAAAFALICVVATSANAQQRRHYDPPPDPEPEPEQPDTLPPERIYDDEPPLDFHQRRWRAYTRHWRPQRFHLRDTHTRFGFNPPYYGGFHDPHGFDGGHDVDYYLQGRHDEHQFREWKDSNDIGYAAYRNAMRDGLAAFDSADYPTAAAAFLRAAKQNQGDPAARLHATYALVAIRNYDDAVLILRRALQLQSRLVDLPLDIPAEYSRRRDFDAHFKHLSDTANVNPDHAGVWMLLGFYQLFSDQGAAAAKSIQRSVELAPDDPLILLLHERARYAAIATPPLQRWGHDDRQATAQPALLFTCSMPLPLRAAGPGAAESNISQ